VGHPAVTGGRRLACSDPAVHDAHSFSSETTGLLTGVRRHQPAVGADHAPPGQPLLSGEDVAYGPCRSGETCLLRDLAVGRDLARPQRADDVDHGPPEFGPFRGAPARAQSPGLITMSPTTRIRMTVSMRLARTTVLIFAWSAVSGGPPEARAALIFSLCGPRKPAPIATLAA
jgi:hypothetical protein